MKVWPWSALTRQREELSLERRRLSLIGLILDNGIFGACDQSAELYLHEAVQSAIRLRVAYENLEDTIIDSAPQAANTSTKDLQST